MNTLKITWRIMSKLSKHAVTAAAGAAAATAAGVANGVAPTDLAIAAACMGGFVAMVAGAGSDSATEKK